MDADGVREPLLQDDADAAAAAPPQPHTRVTPVFAPVDSFGPAGLSLPAKAGGGGAARGSGSLAARGELGLGLVEDQSGEAVVVDVGDAAPIADANGDARVRGLQALSLTVPQSYVGAAVYKRCQRKICIARS